MLSVLTGILFFCSLRLKLLCSFFHSCQLVPPESFKCGSPFVQRTNPLRLEPVKLLPPLPAYLHESNVQQNSKVL